MDKVWCVGGFVGENLEVRYLYKKVVQQRIRNQKVRQSSRIAGKGSSKMNRKVILSDNFLMLFLDSKWAKYHMSGETAVDTNVDVDALRVTVLM